MKNIRENLSYMTQTGYRMEYSYVVNIYSQTHKRYHQSQHNGICT